MLLTPFEFIYFQFSAFTIESCICGAFSRLRNLHTATDKDGLVGLCINHVGQRIVYLVLNEQSLSSFECHEKLVRLMRVLKQNDFATGRSFPRIIFRRIFYIHLSRIVFEIR